MEILKNVFNGLKKYVLSFKSHPKLTLTPFVSIMRNLNFRFLFTSILSYQPSVHLPKKIVTMMFYEVLQLYILFHKSHRVLRDPLWSFSILLWCSILVLFPIKRKSYAFRFPPPVVKLYYWNFMLHNDSLLFSNEFLVISIVR